MNKYMEKIQEDAMKKRLSPRIRFCAGTWKILAVGIVPIFLALVYIGYARFFAPAGYAFGAEWQMRYQGFLYDSVGLSFLLLFGGAAVREYAERHDPRD